MNKVVSGGEDIQLVEVSAATGANTGNNNQYSFANSEKMTSGVLHNNKLYLAGGVTHGGGPFNYMRPAITEYDMSLTQNWSKVYISPGGVSQRLYSESLIIDQDSFMMSGFGDFSGISANFDPWVSKLDLNGQISWVNYYHFSNHTACQIFESALVSDGYIHWAQLNSGTASSDILLFKTDKSGNILWAKSYGGSGREDQAYVWGNPKMIVHNGYIWSVCTSSSFGSGDKDIILLKTDLNGNISQGCATIEPFVQYRVQNPYETTVTMNNTTGPVPQTNAITSGDPEIQVFHQCLGTGIQMATTKPSLDIQYLRNSLDQIRFSIENTEIHPASSTVQLIDLNGRVLASQDFQLRQGIQEIAIPNTHLAVGVYLTRFSTSENADQTLKIPIN